MKYISIIFMALILMSCRSQPMERVRIEYREADTTAIYKRLSELLKERSLSQRSSDSTIDRSSERIVVNAAGDTVRIYSERIVYRASLRETELLLKLEAKDRIVDSLMQRDVEVRIDSVPYPVERKLTWWEQTKMDVGGWAISIAIIAMVVIALMAWRAKKLK